MSKEILFDKVPTVKKPALKAVLEKCRQLEKEKPLDFENTTMINPSSPFTIVPPSIEEVLKSDESLQKLTEVSSENNTDSLVDYSNLLKQEWSILNFKSNMKAFVGVFINFMGHLLGTLNEIKETIKNLEPTKKRFEKLESDHTLLKDEFVKLQTISSDYEQRLDQFRMKFIKFKNSNPVLVAKYETWFDEIMKDLELDFE